MQRSEVSQFVEEIAKEMYTKNLRARLEVRFESVKTRLKKNKEIVRALRKCVNDILFYVKRMKDGLLQQASCRTPIHS